MKQCADVVLVTRTFFSAICAFPVQQTRSSPAWSEARAALALRISLSLQDPDLPLYWTEHTETFGSRGATNWLAKKTGLWAHLEVGEKV